LLASPPGPREDGTRRRHRSRRRRRRLPPRPGRDPGPVGDFLAAL